MRKKINAGIMLIAAIAILATAACSVCLFYDILGEQIYEDLRSNARILSMLELDAMPDRFHSALGEDELRVTLIDGEGNVLYDSTGDASAMENHSGRPEIQKALAEGEGRNTRKSETSARQMFYYAMRLEDGRVLRIGKATDSIFYLVRNMAVLIAIVAVAIFALCAFYAHRLTERLMRPIREMEKNIVLADECEVYEEMRPFVATIKRQHMDILNYAKQRQEFTANVSHELKTPLTAISGYAELIAGGVAVGKDMEHFAGEIHANAERLKVLIDDIIELSELDDGSVGLVFETVDLYELAHNCISQMQLQAQKNEVSLKLEGGPVSFSASRTLMEELIYNLCSNAVRYNKKGGSVTVSVESEGGRPVLTVRDTGIGIPKEQQERVFERFYRVDKSRSKSTGGTGLGLAIVKHIVAQHGAQIFLESEEGVGTVVKVVF